MFFYRVGENWISTIRSVETDFNIHCKEWLKFPGKTILLQFF